MRNLTLNTNAKGRSHGLNVSLLNESECGKEAYSKVVDQQKGTLTQTYIRDVDTIYDMAILKMNIDEDQLQIDILQKFAIKHHWIAETIDPNRFDFTITRAMDNEVCINRKASSGGHVKIIIHDDGLIAFSYLPTIANIIKERLTFHKYESLDVEQMLYQFFNL